MQRWGSRTGAQEPSLVPWGIAAATHRKENEASKKKQPKKYNNKTQSGQHFPFEAEICQHSFQFKFAVKMQSYLYVLNTYFYRNPNKIHRRVMQLHQKLKRRDGRTEQNRLWKRTPHLCLLPVLIPQEKKSPWRGSLQEKPQHNFLLLYFPTTGYSFLGFTVSFLLFFPLLLPTAWWSPLSQQSHLLLINHLTASHSFTMNPFFLSVETDVGPFSSSEMPFNTSQSYLLPSWKEAG